MKKLLIFLTILTVIACQKEELVRPQFDCIFMATNVMNDTVTMGLVDSNMRVIETISFLDTGYIHFSYYAGETYYLVSNGKGVMELRMNGNLHMHIPHCGGFIWKLHIDYYGQ